MTQTSKYSRSTRVSRSVTSLCREWRQTHLKAALEISMLDEADDAGVALIGDVAEATKLELERAVAAGEFSTLDDGQAALTLALVLPRDNEMATDRAELLVRAVHRGMNSIRNVTTQPRAA